MCGTFSTRSQAQALEEEMTDAGKATPVESHNKPVMYIQYDDRNAQLAQAADDLLNTLLATGRYAFSLNWDAGMEMIEVRVA